MVDIINWFLKHFRGQGEKASLLCGVLQTLGDWRQCSTKEGDSVLARLKGCRGCSSNCRCASPFWWGIFLTKEPRIKTQTHTSLTTPPEHRDCPSRCCSLERQNKRKAGWEHSTAEHRCGIGRKSRSRAPLYSEDKQVKEDSHFCLTNSSRFSVAIRALPPRGLPHTVWAHGLWRAPQEIYIYIPTYFVSTYYGPRLTTGWIHPKL